MIRSNALAQLHDAAALWSAGHGGPEAVVRAACDALASGACGYPLAMLAALPLRALDDRDVEELLEQALAEVGLSYYPPRGGEAEEAAVAVMGRRTLSSAVRPRDLALWAHRAFGHDQLPLAQRLAELDDVYDMVEYAVLTAADVDADVIAEAQRIAAPEQPTE